jgi:hypothetical protein
MSSCAAPAASPCRTGRGRVAAQYHTARFRLVPQLAKALSVPVPALRWRGSYGYLTGYLSEDDDDTIKLCRIQYLGDPDAWAFAIWQASSDSYADAVLLDGHFTGHPTEALDPACTLYLGDARDPQPLSGEPLKD